MKEILTKQLIIKLIIFVVICGSVTIAVRNDYSLYGSTIGTITKISEASAGTRTGNDGTYDYKERYYVQTITAVLRNGSQKGRTVTIENKYGKSQVYDIKYKTGDDIFIENIKAQGSGFTASVTGVKRDWFVALILCLLFGLFLMTGGREGALTILSLVLNMAAFYGVLLLYGKGINLLAMTIPMAIFFTAMLLFFMHGWNQKTLLSLVSTIAAAAVTTLIAFAVLKFSNVDYDFMDYLSQPYSQINAGYIFLSEILIGCLGAIMDVVVTIVMTVDQITATSDASPKSLRESCKAVGDDIVGTMITIMFFTNIAACLPRFILSMRNGIAFHTIIRYNVFFELARFLTGSIGIVIAIPISAAIAVGFYERRMKKC